MIDFLSRKFPGPCRAVAAALLACVLSACGGGGGDDSGASASLPATLSVTLPTTAQPLGTPLTFASNAMDPGASLTYRWSFGDGASSSLATPTHAYAKAGVYTVTLTLADNSGKTASTTGTLSIADLAIVQGQLCSGGGTDGWCWQRPLPQGNPIADYAFADDVHGWAVGAAGTLLATTDGGLHWSAQASGTTLDLDHVAFVSPTVAWTSAGYGEVLKTVDGGVHWQSLSDGQSDSVQTLHAIDANTAWVVFYNAAATTVDGGAHWTRIVSPQDDSFSLTLVDTMDVWAYPTFTDGTATLRHSVDGGVTWSMVGLPPNPPGLLAFPSTLQFTDADHAYLVEQVSGSIDNGQTDVTRQMVWRTADRGMTWQAAAAVLGGQDQLTFQVVDATNLFASTYLGIAHSADAGATSQPVMPPDLQGSYRVSFRAMSAMRLLIIDGRGQTYLSTDAGATWNVRSAGASALPTLGGVWFFDAHEGLAVAGDGTSLRTVDGGQTWADGPTNGYLPWGRPQFSADGSIGWVISANQAIYRSTDQGRSWLAPVAQLGLPLFGVTDFHFVDTSNGWAVSPYGSVTTSTFYKTTDGGLSWHSAAAPVGLYGLTAIRFADSSRGVAVGPSGFAVTTADAGATWTVRPTGVANGLNRVAFADATTAVAVGNGGEIVRSTDAGISWTSIPSPTSNALNDVRFVSPLVGHATGNTGTLLVTQDGGLSWANSVTRTQADFQAVFFTDAQTGWVVGSNGSILATATGGR